MALIDKYEVSEEKQESVNKFTNRWNTCKIKDTSQDPDIWFNELYNLNLKFNKINLKRKIWRWYEGACNWHPNRKI